MVDTLYEGIEKRSGERRQADRDLIASEEKFRMIFENANDVIAIVDKNGNIFDVNNKVFDVFGYKPEEIIGKGFFEMGVLSPDDLKFSEGLFEDVLSGKHIPMVELKGIRKDGMDVFIEINPRLIIEDGELKGILAIIRDITERKRAEDARRETEEKYKTIFKNANDVVVYTDVNGAIIEVNDKIEDMFGYKRNEVIGKNFANFTIFSPNDLKKAIESFGETVAGREGIIIEFEVLRKDRKKIFIEVSSRLIKKDNEVKGIINIIRDITERKLSGEALKESEEKFKTIFETANDVIAYTDIYGNCIDINDKVYDVFGLKREAVIGRNFTEFSILSPQDMEGAKQGLKNAVEGNFAPVKDFLAFHNDGSPLFIEVNSRITTKNGNVTGIINIIRDVTDRKISEKAIRESEEKFRTIFENANDVIAYIDNYGTIIDVNKKVEDTFGYKPDELIGKTFYEFGVMKPDDINERLEGLKDVVSGKPIRLLEAFEVYRKDNVLIYIEVNTRTIKKDDKVTGVLVVIRDVTQRYIAEMELQKAHDELEQKVKDRTFQLTESNRKLQQEIIERLEAEAALKESEERFRTIFEEANDIIMYIDKNGIVVDLNEKVEDVFGYKNTEIIGKHFAEFALINPEAMAKAVEYFDDLMAGNKPPQTIEFEIQKKDGTTAYIEGNAREIRKNDELQGILTIIRDSTRRKKVEDARKKKEEELRVRLSRYVAKNLVDLLVKYEDGGFPEYEKKEVTVLFADIRSFSTIAEGMNAEEVVVMLNEFFSAMVEVVFRHNGALDKFVGDQLMAVFGLIPSENVSSLDAVSAAIEMQRVVDKITETRKTANKNYYEIGIGINTGIAIAGNVGAENRMDYTVIGDSVNIAARFEEMAQGGEIIIGEQTYLQSKRHCIKVKEKGITYVTNRNKPVKCYYILNNNLCDS